MPLKRLSASAKCGQIMWKCDMTKRKIIKNSIQCNLCGDIIESKFRHHFVECSCGACFVDGGHVYQRIGFKEEGCYTDLSVIEEIDYIEERYKNMSF